MGVKKNTDHGFGKLTDGMILYCTELDKFFFVSSYTNAADMLKEIADELDWDGYGSSDLETLNLEVFRPSGSVDLVRNMTFTLDTNGVTNG